MVDALVRLFTKDWIYLIVLIAGVTAALVGGQYQIRVDIMRQMDSLDLRWQERIDKLYNRLHVEVIETISNNMEKENRIRIIELEKRTSTLK